MAITYTRAAERDQQVVHRALQTPGVGDLVLLAISVVTIGLLSAAYLGRTTLARATPGASPVVNLNTVADAAALEPALAAAFDNPADRRLAARELFGFLAQADGRRVLPNVGAIARAEVPMPVKYSKDHQYVTVENGVATVGITDSGQEKLSDVTSVELPRVGEHVKKGSAVGVVESIKAANDFDSPVSGEILAVNEELNGKPELVNEDAEGAGWIFKIKLAEPSELDVLLDREAYLTYVREQG